MVVWRQSHSDGVEPGTLFIKTIDLINILMSTPEMAQNVIISPEGLNSLLSSPKQLPNEGTLWTTDYRTQLPIRLAKTGTASLQPTTLNAAFHEISSLLRDKPALSEKENGKWVTLSFKEYFDSAMTFGKALVELGICSCSVNIIGFNAPHWNIAFYGSIFAKCVPVGIYTTNSIQVCEYIATQSECALVVAENVELARKYESLLAKGILKYLVIYRGQALPENTYEGRVLLWKDFMARGKRVDNSTILSRFNQARPGNCCSIVYTSGTTGLPKGVMLSHDNYTWLKSSLQVMLNYKIGENDERIVSFLPLSHAAAQFSDIIVSMMAGVHVYFAEPDALQGGLINTLLDVRPTIFFSVPRVWEKIYDKMMQVAKSNGWLKSKLAGWAKSIGAEQTLRYQSGQSTSFEYSIARRLVYDNVRKALGLEEARYLIFGAAPMHSDIRQYFLSLGMFLINGYGMSESSGPETLSQPSYFKLDSSNEMREAGVAFDGTELKIVKADSQDKDGQICYRGRNVFMGYYKNKEQTARVIDSEGFLHSGDQGYIDERGVLFITGRLKELIITGAGENIPPLLIQQNIKQALPWLGNVILVGDGRKFLTCLVTLPVENGKLSPTVVSEFEKANIKFDSVQQAANSPQVFKLILAGINKANEKAISRAQTVKTVSILNEDFTVDNGLLTPSLKMKRGEILKRYADTIDRIYRETKL